MAKNVFCDQICEIYKNHDVPFAEICIKQNMFSYIWWATRLGHLRSTTVLHYNAFCHTVHLYKTNKQKNRSLRNLDIAIFDNVTIHCVALNATYFINTFI